MRRGAAAVLAGVVVGATVFGCHSDDAVTASDCDGGSAATGVGCDDGGIPYSQYWYAHYGATCHFLVDCGDEPDQATCLSEWQPGGPYPDTLDQDVAAGRIIYDGAAARACVDAMNAKTCKLTDAVDDSACDRVFVGTVESGGGCFLSEECADQGHCSGAGLCPSQSCCPGGTCQSAMLAVQVGGQCAPYEQPNCAPGLACVVPVESYYGTCQQRVGAGGSCAGQLPCAPGLYCDVTETCNTVSATGTPCGACDDPKDYCDRNTGICTPLPGPGSPCSSPDLLCIHYAYCDSATDTCVTPPTPGQPCDPNGTPCVDSTCNATSETCVLVPLQRGACS